MSRSSGRGSGTGAPTRERAAAALGRRSRVAIDRAAAVRTDQEAALGAAACRVTIAADTFDGAALRARARDRRALPDDRVAPRGSRTIEIAARTALTVAAFAARASEVAIVAADRVASRGVAARTGRRFARRAAGARTRRWTTWSAAPVTSRQREECPHHRSESLHPRRIPRRPTRARRASLELNSTCSRASRFRRSWRARRRSAIRAGARRGRAA
jgi:hypothetical protein